jgi:hypothetical protein
MEVKKLSELEVVFYEQDFDSNNNELKKEIVRDISTFDIAVWNQRKDILIRNFPRGESNVIINCPILQNFDFPEHSDKQSVTHGNNINFRYNGKFYTIRQLAIDAKEYSTFI